jgi:LmbE family N-acetylglucosaminyl deacetylase
VKLTRKRRGLFSALSSAVSREGLEPPTLGLKGPCSAIELAARSTALYHAGESASTVFLPVPTSALTHIYLSPHLDDAVLSCGGMIHRQAQAGERVVVVTLCAGIPTLRTISAFAEGLHARWQVSAAQAVTARRAEDQAALKTLSAEWIHLEVLDCIYRVDPTTSEALYASEAALFGDWRPSETALLRRSAETLAGCLHLFARRRLYAPLALGHHVDHQLARRAAERAGGVWAYYEDYPYADREANLSPNSKVTGAETRGLAPEIVLLAEADLTAKSRAVAAYTSQISTFWESAADLEPGLRAYAERLGSGRLAERLWRVPAAGSP